ncbi:hypothetical protein [Roseateles sp.]|uniref:hypothetical protein n=1 Tax=Roseateles sp. TaxID=1971397 RepID=UPI0039622B1A
MTTSLKDRIAALEQAKSPEIGIGERMRQIRERRRSMSPEQLAAELAERIKWAMNSPEPEHPMRRAMWRVLRRRAMRLEAADLQRHAG